MPMKLNPQTDLTLHELRMANDRRAEEWISTTAWSPDKRLTELVEEVGEVAGVLKRLNRLDEGVGTSRYDRSKLLTQLGDELADVQITLDLLASCLNVDLAGSTRSKFNETSRKWQLETRL